MPEPSTTPPAPGDGPRRLVVLVSGAGSNLAALLEAAQDPAWGAQVVAVVADRDASGLDHARAAGLPALVVPPHEHPDRAAWDRALADAVAEHRPDLVVSAGFMRILGPAVLGRFPGRVVNTHPALLPSYPGTHGVRDALANGAKVTGCTVHVVDAGVDTGPILAQAVVEVLDDDDEDSLHERVKDVERPLLVDVVGRMARLGWTTTGRKTSIP